MRPARQIQVSAAIALGLSFLAAPAHAGVLPGGLSLSGEGALVSDYRFRGISLSGRGPAVQGGLTLEHDSGLYAGVWGSTISETEGGADVEIDLIMGYARELGDGLTLDLSMAHYRYPSDSSIAFTEVTGTLTYSMGRATPRAGFGYAPGQGSMRDTFGVKRDNLHIFAGFEYPVRGMPVTLDAQVGYEAGYFDARDTGGKLDWRVGGTLAAHGLDLGLFYADSNARLVDARGRNLAAGALIGSVSINF